MFNLMSFFKNLLSTNTQASVRNFFDEMPSLSDYTDSDHKAIVTRSIQPGRSGQVKFQGSWWTAWCNQEVILVPGQSVYVIGRRNISLYVEPVFLSVESSDLQSSGIQDQWVHFGAIDATTAAIY
jgi:membrane protein implicated in regulation of membrane protease activity